MKVYGWCPCKLADAYTMDELTELMRQVREQHKNPLDERGHPLENGRPTIYLLDKAGRRKSDKVAWAITHKLREKREAVHG